MFSHYVHLFDTGGQYEHGINMDKSQLHNAPPKLLLNFTHMSLNRSVYSHTVNRYGPCLFVELWPDCVVFLMG